MKTSNKILLGITGFLIIYLITGLVALRNETIELLARTKAETKYKTVPVDTFTNLDFAAHWNVIIKQGRTHKVEIVEDKSNSLQPLLENVDGTLYCKVEEAGAEGEPPGIHAIVTTPSLRKIKAGNGSKIYLSGFTADSLDIILENGGSFEGLNNQIVHASFKTSGDALLKLTDNTGF